MTHKRKSTNAIIDLNQKDLKFAKEVKRRSDVDFNACLHCHTCAGGCHFSQIMDYMPNRIIRLVQLGLKQEALTCSSIWICVSCNTCSVQCPMGIDISAVTDAICQIAIDEKADVGEPEILKFHEEVLKTIKRYGRTHKLEIMLRYKFYTHDWFRDMGVGLKMLAKHKLDILPSRVSHMMDIKNIFSTKEGCITMHRIRSFDISYYPGCSMATTAQESNLSLLEMFNKIGFNLVELEDWNCCGSTSAHSIDSELALDLAVRNLFLAPPDRPLLVACPNCILRLRHAHLVLKQDDLKRRKYENEWGTTYNTDLNILHFFDLLENINLLHFSDKGVKKLQGLKFVPYYGCMLSRPNALKSEKEYYGLMEEILCSVGGEALSWPFKSQCCGTFLSVAKPDIITPIVNKIIQGAMDAGADCIVTACAMCHLNLEVRCNLKNPVPTIHFSELLSLALGDSKYESWFPRHLVDPRPMLKSKGLIR